jgi:hypothetical protein
VIGKIIENKIEMTVDFENGKQKVRSKVFITVF